MSVTEALRPWFDLALKAATQRDTTKVADEYLADAAKAAEREARAALLDELEAAVREHLRGTDNPANWGVPEDYASGWIGGVNSALESIQQHREGNP